MAEIGLPLCVHGEVTDPQIDIFDREAVFIETVLDPLRRWVPDLRIVLEHVTTSDGVDYVRSGGANIAATITTHHLFINRNHILAGGIRPHYYCLPVAKRESHRRDLIAAAISGDGRFFLGTDSAPHLDAAKLMMRLISLKVLPHGMVRNFIAYRLMKTGSLWSNRMRR